MAVPTIIRADNIGKWFGAVVTTFVPEFTARFQLYLRGDDKPMEMMLVRDEAFSSEKAAYGMFNAWRIEAALLIEAGDM